MNDIELWRALYGLFELLSEREHMEERYQAYFETHSAVFRALDFDRFESYEKSSRNSLPFDADRNFSPEPDFLCASFGDCMLTVFELKTPFVRPIIVQRADGNRQKLCADVESYVSQATEYADSIREREDARAVVCGDLSLPRIGGYRICLVYGLAAENDSVAVTKLLQNRKIPTEIIYFDDLLDRLAARYQSTRVNTDGRDGLCVVYHLVVHPHQACSKSFIADHGEIERNRLSVFVDDGQLVYRCLDATGQEHQLSSGITYNMPVYLRFEFSNDADGIYMSLNIDNEERDLRLGTTQFEFCPDINAMHIGAALTRKHGGRFQMLESYYAAKTMTLKHKLGSFEYFKRRTSNPGPCVEFDAASFLIRSPEGHLYQSVDGCKPAYRSRFGYSIE